MEIGNIAQISRCYKTLLHAYSMEEVQQDVRLTKVKKQIKNKLEEVISFIQNKMANRRNESRQHVAENEIRRVIIDALKECKDKINEDGYSYNGLDQQAQYRKMGEDLMAQQNREKNKKKNIMLFKKAYNKIYKEYSIIGQLRRKTEKAKDVFNGPAFMKYVEEVEGDTLYDPIWEKYGGEYEELADQYLQNNVIKLRRELGF